MKMDIHFGELYLKILAAGFWQIHCGPQHAGCYTHLCSSALLGCTLSTVSHSLIQTPHYLLGLLQRRNHQGPGKLEKNTDLLLHCLRSAKKPSIMLISPENPLKTFNYYRENHHTIYVSPRIALFKLQFYTYLLQ